MNLGLKRRIYTRLPMPIRRYARLAYYLLSSPFGGKRKFNRFKYQIAVNQKEFINYIPPIFSIAINSSCNLRCPNCYFVLLGGEKAFEGGGMIKVEDFKAIIDRYGDHIEQVSLTGGEALGHPKLDELVRIVKDKGIRVMVSTNGVFIERKIDVLKEIDFINVSLDGYNYETFKKYRGGTPAEFDKILYGLDLMRQNDLKFGNSFVLSEENIQEVDLMLEFARTTKPYLTLFNGINPHGCEDFTPLLASSEKVQEALTRITSRNDYPFDIELPVIFDDQSPDFAESSCIQPWALSCFNDKGHLSYCCYIDHDPSIGNMFTEERFNSSSMVDFRKRMINHDYPKKSCLYCHKRFMGQEYGYFHANLGKWIFQGFGGSNAKTAHLTSSNVV